MTGDFFIWCSGANFEILKKCPTERTKYIGIGATIFTTAVLAFLSGGYALYFTFNSYLGSVLFGLFWSALIFNLDRYIVSSMRKEGTLKKQLYMALPRFLIALVLALTISKPLELKLFDGTVSKQLGTKEDAYNQNCETDFIKRRNELAAKKNELSNGLNESKNALYQKDPVFTNAQTERAQKVSETEQFSNQISTNNDIIQKNSWLENAFSRGRPIKIRRYNTTAQSKISENKSLRTRIGQNNIDIKSIDSAIDIRKQELAGQVKTIETQYANQVNGIQAQIDDHEKQREGILQKCRQDAAGDKDILSRLRALGEIKSFGNTAWWASLLITLLFILIETAPIVAKLLSNKGPYDEILACKEHEIFIEQQKEISNMNNEANIFLETILETGKKAKEERLKIEEKKINMEMKANENILNNIAEKQASIAGKMVSEWYEEQLDSLKNNNKNGTK